MSEYEESEAFLEAMLASPSLPYEVTERFMKLFRKRKMKCSEVMRRVARLEAKYAALYAEEVMNELTRRRAQL